MGSILAVGFGTLAQRIIEERLSVVMPVQLIVGSAADRGDKRHESVGDDGSTASVREALALLRLQVRQA